MRVSKRNGTQKRGQNKVTRAGSGAQPKASHPAVEKLVAATRERDQLRQQQAATAEILKVIAASPADVQPVFDTIARSAVHLCGALFSSVYRFDGEKLHFAAQHNWPRKALELTKKSYPKYPDRRQGAGRAILTRSVVCIEDVLRDSDYDKAVATGGGWRRVLAVPMVRSGKPVGTISVAWADPGSIPAHQVALLKTFADQAVIAIENARLFNETKEALERQTATADVLKVISASPADVQPVLNAVADRAAAIFEGAIASVFLVEGELLNRKAVSSAHPHPSVVPHVPIRRTLVTGRAVLERRTIEVVDILPLLDSEYPDAKDNQRRLGWRSLIAVPLLREGNAIGAIGISTQQPRAFSREAVKLLETFADQAVIAIENARLFNETKEALEQQKASAEVLGTISSSIADAQPVFEKIVESCARLFEGTYVGVGLVREDGLLYADAYHGPKREEFFKAFPMPVDADSGTGRAILAREIGHYPDVLAADVPPNLRRSMERVGGKSALVAPMLWEGRGIGGIVVGRQASGPFSEKAIRQLKTFADQAVIAIQNARLFNETKESLERQTATAEILKVISSSPTDVQPVFEAVAERAAQLCNAANATVLISEDGTTLRRVATFGHAMVSPARPATSTWINGRAFVERRTIHVEDATAALDEYPETRENQQKLGFRTMVAVPMMREGRAVGTIGVWRREFKPFSKAQIELLETFAAQAVIAIENVRLFNETKEALEQQTATAEILRVISQSPTDTQPVFDAIVQAAQRLINGNRAVILLRRDTHFEAVAMSNTDPRTIPADVRRVPLDPQNNFPSRAILRGEVVHVPDWQAQDVPEFERGVAKAYGFGSGVQVPLLRQGVGIGALAVARDSKGAYQEKEIALLRSFADQAVIAIENVRLFNETKQALERQTATAEILKVISESPTDTRPVFEAIVRSGLKLFADSTVFVGIVDGEVLRAEAAGGFAAVLGRAVPITRESAGGIAILERRIVNISDTEAPDAPPYARENGRRMNLRSMTQMPMFREGQAIGTIGVLRREPGGLDDKQLALLKTFADQAVIAIENARLFKELQSRTEALSNSVQQLTALGEVGQAISSTLELDEVLQTVVTRAVQLTNLDGGAIYEYDAVAEAYNLKASERFPEEFIDTVRRTPIRKGEGATGRTAVTLEPVQVPDILDHAYQGNRREMLLRAGYRAILAVPLLREENLVGALMVMRKTPGEFAPAVIELLKTFAVQSALAIQNARLFREIEEKSRQLETASQHKSQFLASMSHELRTPLNAILGFNEMILDGIYGDLTQDIKAPLENIQSSGKHLLRLINNVLDLAKIEAGRMELAVADYSVQDTVASVHSTLKPLAAEKGLEFVADVPADIPPARGDSGRIAQCLMNLAGNSLKFTKEGRVAIAVTQDNGLLRFSVADTGIGIPAEKISTLFTEFKQTDATIASEYGGTGLGLSITKKFIEMHGGRIWVESEPGKGSNFKFEIPLRTAA